MTTSIAVAMSGGVDSSVAACLLKKQGYGVIGVFMKFHDSGSASEGSGCCSLEDSNDARKVADRLGIPFYVISMQDEFREHVREYFLDSYMRGETPNPCVYCNREVKFNGLLSKLAHLGVEKIATGHYARIECYSGGRKLLKKGLDVKKDQSYFLFNMTEEQLSKVIFPLGEMTKGEVRAVAADEGLPVHEKAESQDVCFVDGKGYYDIFLKERNIPLQCGNIMDCNGEIIGHHQGYYRYTVGQRKGLGVALGYPVYVISINAKKNEVVLGPKEALMKKKFTVRNVSLLTDNDKDFFSCCVKIRYGHSGASGTVTFLENNRAEINLVDPVHAVTPGQAAVFYDKDVVLGGGWIE